MTKSVKKVISSLLTASMILSILCSMAMVVSAEITTIGGWNIDFKNGMQGEAFIDYENAYSGKSSLKIISRSPSAPNLYINANHTVEVEVGKTYVVGAKVKSLHSTTLQFTVSWDKRRNIAAFGDTFDWTNYEFEFVPEKTGTETLMLIIDGTSDGIWLDDVHFTCKETGENLISDGTFEEGGVVLDESSTAINGDITKLYNKVLTADSFTAYDMESVIGGFKYMPVYKASGITIDGNGDDWSSYTPSAMPTLPTQYHVYISDDRKLDASAICKFAQDNDNLYLYIEVTDDIFHYEEGGKDYYWRGDSIQFALSRIDETYGTEFGLAHNPKTNKGEVYSSSMSDAELAAIDLKTMTSGNKVIYEASIPWKLKFNEKPGEFLFDVLVNDNDGDGRRYCLELAPGIAEGKTNEVFPKLEIIDGDNDWYVWAEGSKLGYTHSDNKFTYFLVNKGAAKSFEITYQDGNTETVDVPAESGIRREFIFSYEETGEAEIATKFKAGDAEKNVKSHISIKNKPANAEYHQTVMETNTKHISELKKLLDSCEKQGIATDYEMVNYHVMVTFEQYLKEDLENNFFDNTYYTERALNNLYEEAKTNLNAYLDGSKKSKSVPKYITSKTTFKGGTAYALAEENGQITERPLSFLGYVLFGRRAEDISILNDLGANTVQLEIGPTGALLSTPVIANWGTTVSNNPTHELELDTSVKRSGNSSLKMSYENELQAYQYLHIYQYVPVTPGKTYTLSGYIKADNVTGSYISPDNWSNRQRFEGTYDWTNFSYTYTAPPGQEYTVIRIGVDAVCDSVYFDDFTFCEEGSDINILRNGDFEEASTEEIEINPYSGEVATLKKQLEKAEELDIAVSMMLAPHYFPSDYINKYNIGQTGESWMFLKYNINSEPAKKLIESYLNAIVPIIAEYDSVQSIMISNEPAFKVEYSGDYYLDDWHDYLRKVYQDDINALNLAYGENHTSFDEIDFLRTNLVKSYDYKKFNDKKVAEWHQWMADIVHNLAPDIPVNSKVMNYIRDTHANGVYNGTGYEDYVGFMDLNGCDIDDYIDDEAGPLVSSMWMDYMRSLKDVPVINSEDHIIPNRSDNYDDNVTDYVARNIYMGAIHGRAVSDIWAWDRAHDGVSDFNDSILFRPDMMAAVHKTLLDLNRNSYEIAALQNRAREIGILYLDSSVMMDANTPYALYQAYASCLFGGKSPLFVTESQLYKMNDCKMLIIPNQKFVSEKALNSVAEYIRAGGKAIILNDDSLRLSDRKSENDSALLDYIYDNSYVIEYDGASNEIRNMTETELHAKIRDIFAENNLYNIAVRDSETGEAIDWTEIDAAYYDGKIILNMVNYGEDRTVNINFGDRQISQMYDINRDITIEKDVELKQYIPVTVAIETDNPFIDTYGHWAEDDIISLYQDGVVSGMSESEYAPQKTLTRAEFLALLMRCSKNAVSSEKTFTEDVSAGSWYADAVSMAISRGIISKDEPFRPNDNISREEMCGFIVKCYESEKGTINASSQTKFTDAYSIGNIEAVEKAVATGIMYGRDDGSFDPRATATRAEAAAVVLRYIDKN